MISNAWYVLLLCTSYSSAARILGLWPLATISHYFLGNKLLKELATRGHNVTMISPFNSRENIDSYRNIVLDDTDILMREKFGTDLNFFDIGAFSPIGEVIAFSHFAPAYSEILMRNGKVQDLLQSNETFDLVIVDMFGSEALWGFAYHFNCPLIVLSPLGSSYFTNHLVGNPAPISWVPEYQLPFSAYMTFYERLQNAKHSILLLLFRYFSEFPRLNQQLHEFFPNAPQLEELLYNKTALVLENSHPSVLNPKPRVPGLIEIGGFHIEEPKALREDLQTFMDNAKEGVILFSMGSTVKCKDLNDDARAAILRAFAKIKQQIIWKWEDEQLPGKPENVRIIKWCPQNDVLAHPNLKLFITHGGLLSITEAVNFGVPMLVLPVFADQEMNMASVTRKGYGIGILQADLSETTLSTALNEVLNNPKYRENVKFGSQLLRDRLIRPIDTAIYWTEYVIKYNGAAHLRTAAMNLEWYQIYSIDIALFLTVIIASIILVPYHIVKRISGEVKINGAKKKN